MRLAAHAKKIATSTADQNEQLRMALQMKAKANQAGRLQKSNLSYQQLLRQTAKTSTTCSASGRSTSTSTSKTPTTK